MSNFDPFNEQAAPAVANDRPAPEEAAKAAPAPTSSPAPASFDPFNAPQAAETGEKLPPLPEIEKNTFVCEDLGNGQLRYGLVVKAGTLEPDPNREGPRHAVVVAWFDHLSQPIQTDQLKVI